MSADRTDAANAPQRRSPVIPLLIHARPVLDWQHADNHHARQETTA